MAFCNTWQSAAVISSEGGSFLNGRSAYDLPMWNKLWDGASIGVERIGRGSISAKHARGGLIIAVQEEQFEQFCEAREAKAMDIGFLARGLFLRPINNIGTRYISADPDFSNRDSLKLFQNRTKDMLRQKKWQINLRKIIFVRFSNLVQKPSSVGLIILMVLNRLFHREAYTAIYLAMHPRSPKTLRELLRYFTILKVRKARLKLLTFKILCESVNGMQMNFCICLVRLHRSHRNIVMLRYLKLAIEICMISGAL